MLLTSRAPLPAAQGASLRLDLLPEDDALALFLTTYGQPLGRPLTEDERQAARAIAVALGRHTLAIKLAAANAATQQWSLMPLAAEFRANPLRDAWLEDSETAVAFVLASSVAAMSAGGQRLFAALGAFASADVGRKAALALARALGDDENEAERSLRWILDLRLADPAEIELPGGEKADRERLRLHPLSHAYARDLFAGSRTLPNAVPWDGTQREQTDRALAVWYAVYTIAVESNSGMNYLALTPDEANITGALEWALAHGDDRSVARICDGMRGFWRDTGRTQAGLRYLPQGAAATGRIADQSGERTDRRRQAKIALYHGNILQYTGRLFEAEAVYIQDLELSRVTEDRQGERYGLVSLGQVALLRGALGEAANYFEQALVIAREMDDHLEEIRDLNELGQVALRRWALDETANYFQASLPIFRETQDRQGENAVLSGLGAVALRREELDAAADYFEQALVIARETQDRQGEGADLVGLGQVALLDHRLEEANDYLAQALPILRETQDRQAEGVTLVMLGLAAQARGQYAEAAKAYRAGIAMHREMGDRINVAANLQLLGALLLQHSDDRAGGVAAFAKAIGLLQVTGLADREREAREAALALGCRADELPPPRQAGE